MGEFTTTYGQISPRVGIQAVARMLTVGQPLAVTQRYGQTDNAKSRSGNTIKWRRYEAFAVSTAPLAEGVPPTVQPLTKNDYTAVLAQYGAVAELTDVCVDLHEDNPLDVAVKLSGRQMAQTIEILTIDVLKAGTTVYYASGAAGRTTVNAPISRGDLRLVKRGFDRNDGQPITKIVAPTASISTMGVEAAYIAMGHTDLEPDIRGITGFKSYVEYGTPGARQPGEVGSVEGFRFILTRNFTPWASIGAAGTEFLSGGARVTQATACDVYPIICVAEEGYAVVRLQGVKAAEIKVRQPNGDPDSGDPLAQKGTVGWKTWFAAAITNEYWVARIECACTASPK